GLISFRVDVFGRRRSLILLAILSAFGGVALILFRSTFLLIAMGFIAMLNGMGTDRSAAFAIEQAAIPNLVYDRTRTWALSWYNVVIDVGGAIGALAGAMPVVLQRTAGLDMESAYRFVFTGYSLANLGTAAFYLLLTNQIEIRKSVQSLEPVEIT